MKIKIINTKLHYSLGDIIQHTKFYHYRLHGPSHMSYYFKYKEWEGKHGGLHRLDGPAIIQFDERNKIAWIQYHINGKKVK